MSTKKKPKILLVNWGIESAYYPLAETVKRFGDQVYLATTTSLPTNIKNLFKSENIIYTNPYHERKLIEDVQTFISDNQISFDIVTTFYEMSICQTAALANFLGCKYYLPRGAALKTSFNKLLMRLALKKAGIKQPIFSVFWATDFKKGYEFFKKFKKPMVIKPVHSGSSYGARIIKKDCSLSKFEKLVAQSMNDVYRRSDEWIKYENKNDLKFLIEEYIGGTMVSCDGVVKSLGKITFIGNTEFQLSPPPLLYQIGHMIPIASLNKKQISTCEDYAEKVINKLGFQYCGFHCELKFENNQPYLIEISGRFPGGVMLESYQNTSQVDIFYLFFSIFNPSKKKPKKNKEFYKSEVLTSIYYPAKFGLIKYINKPNFKKISEWVHLENVFKGNIFLDIKNELGIPILYLITRSKILDSVELSAKVTHLISQVNFSVSQGFRVKSQNSLKKLLNIIQKMQV